MLAWWKPAHVQMVTNNLFAKAAKPQAHGTEVSCSSLSLGINEKSPHAEKEAHLRQKESWTWQIFRAAKWAKAEMEEWTGWEKRMEEWTEGDPFLWRGTA